MLASFALQVAIAVLVLFVPIGQAALSALATGFQNLLNFPNEGIMFMFGALGDPSSLGFIFFVRVLPVIIFFAALMEVLYYLKIMKWIVLIIGGAIRKVLGTSQAESSRATMRAAAAKERSMWCTR